MSNSVVKQVIVVRTDLDIPLGKIIASCCHNSMNFLLEGFEGKNYQTFLTDEEVEWADFYYRKIVLGVPSLEKLKDVANKANSAYLTVSMIEDRALTVFKEPTYISLSIGPNRAEDIDKITGCLKLYNGPIKA